MQDVHRFYQMDDLGGMEVGWIARDGWIGWMKGLYYALNTNISINNNKTHHLFFFSCPKRINKPLFYSVLRPFTILHKGESH